MPDQSSKVLALSRLLAAHPTTPFIQAAAAVDNAAILLAAGGRGSRPAALVVLTLGGVYDSELADDLADLLAPSRRRSSS